MTSIIEFLKRWFLLSIHKKFILSCYIKLYFLPKACRDSLECINWEFYLINPDPIIPIPGSLWAIQHRWRARCQFLKPLRKSISVAVPARLRIGIEKLLFCIIVISCICSVCLIASSADPPMRDRIAREKRYCEGPCVFYCNNQLISLTFLCYGLDSRD